MTYKNLFSPIKLRGLELKNRVMLPAMNTMMAQGKITEQTIGYYKSRAEGGCGLLIFEASVVHPKSQAPMYMGLYTEEQRDELKKVTKAVHDAGGKIGIQLLHTGMVGGAYLKEFQTSANMSVEDIEDIVRHFGQAARLACEAGFDVIELHTAHSYLLHEFLSSGMNERADEYGGSLENRARFPFECIKAMRGNMPEDMPLIMRTSAFDDMLENGLTMDDVVWFINESANIGVDAVDLSRGNVKTFAVTYEVPPINIERGWNIEKFGEIKARVDIPVITSGRITEPDIAERAIAEGKADLVVVGRGQIADPEWCNKAQSGRVEEIVRCIGCMQGCYDKAHENSGAITCLRNPRVSQEHLPLVKAEHSKNVMVVGGGMGGMYVSKYLKLRGHEPVIYEREDEVGGQFILAGRAPGKGEIEDSVRAQAVETARLGVEIRLNTAVTAELIKEECPDTVVIAVGAHSSVPPIDGVKGANVHLSHDILGDKQSLEGRVAVIGGGAVGVEVAEFLAANGSKCTVIEMTKRIGAGYGIARRLFAKADFRKFGIDTIVLARCTQISESGVEYEQEGDKSFLACDHVVLATGSKSRAYGELEAACKELGIEFCVIGDAREVSDALGATQDAYEAALQI